MRRLSALTVAGAILLAGCSSSHHHAATSTTITPKVVNPTSTGGEAGVAPLVVSSLTPVPGGKAGSGQVALKTRTLIINAVTHQKAANDPNSTLVDLDLAVQNITDAPIANQPNFFQLIGPEGDAFGHQYNSSDYFYGPIAAHGSRTGTVDFAVPTAAVSGLRLLYRPDTGADAVIIPLSGA